LEPTKDNVLSGAKAHADKPDAVREKLLLREAEQPFFNASPLSLGSLSDTQAADDLMSSPSARMLGRSSSISILRILFNSLAPIICFTRWCNASPAST
jgi:hypothetical protein